MIWQPVRQKIEKKAESNSNIREDRLVWSGLEWISCMIVSMVLVRCEKGGGCAKSRERTKRLIAQRRVCLQKGRTKARVEKRCVRVCGVWWC